MYGVSTRFFWLDKSLDFSQEIALFLDFLPFIAEREFLAPIKSSRKIDELVLFFSRYRGSMRVIWYGALPP